MARKVFVEDAVQRAAARQEMYANMWKLDDVDAEIPWDVLDASFGGTEREAFARLATWFAKFGEHLRTELESNSHYRLEHLADLDHSLRQMQHEIRALAASWGLAFAWELGSQPKDVLHLIAEVVEALHFLSLRTEFRDGSTAA